MDRSDQIFELMLAEPFRPFRIRMTDGRVFDIRDPHAIGVGVKTATISGRARNDGESEPGRHHVQLDSIESVEVPLPFSFGEGDAAGPLGEPLDRFDQVFELMVAEPFRPFQIRVTDGKVFDIIHPSMVAVGVKSARISASVRNNEGESKIQHYELPLNVIESIAPLDMQPVIGTETVPGLCKFVSRLMSG